MNKTLKNVILFFTCNFAGFSTGPIVYNVLLIKLIDIEKAGLTESLVNQDIGIIQMTWLICALFSVSFFFLSGLWRKFFLLSPIFIPLTLTIITLMKY